MLAPLPRLTSALRGHFDADQAYLLRKTILQALTLPRFHSLPIRRSLVSYDSPTPIAAGENLTISCCSLSPSRPHDEWELARKIVPGWDDGNVSKPISARSHAPGCLTCNVLFLFLYPFFLAVRVFMCDYDFSLTDRNRNLCCSFQRSAPGI
jgi:hypothetical protein